MKVLIVDDEKHVRDAVRMLADWETLGIDTVLEAEDGLGAIRIIEDEQPQIIITDMMMPVKSGVELMEWIRKHAPHSKTIVISGHNDFEFVRHTVKYGGTDYLLKPIDPAQLQEAIRKAAETWRLEEQQRIENQTRNIEMNRLKPVYRDKLLSSLLNDLTGFSSIEDQLYREFPALRDARHCRVAVLSIDTMERSIRDKFKFSLDLLFFALINICNEFLEKSGRGVAFRYWKSDSEIILLLWEDLPNAPALIGEISQGIYRTLHARFDFGIGSEKAFPSGLQESYKEAQLALRHRNLLDRTSWIHLYEAGPVPRLSTLHLTEFEESIRLAVRSGKTEQIQSAVQQWIDAVRKLDKITVEQLELWWHEYSVLKARWIQEFFKGEEPDLRLPSENSRFIVPLDDQGKLSIPLWQEELTRSMIELSRLLFSRQVQGSSVIYDIARYIRNNYYKDLTLQDIANRFYLSREYISRKFKQEFQENIVDFLSRIRIDKAKVLLMNPLLKISEIAQMVGYHDEKYFSKVFKKLEGRSPNEYRKSLTD